MYVFNYPYSVNKRYMQLFRGFQCSLWIRSKCYFVNLGSICVNRYVEIKEVLTCINLVTYKAKK